MDKKSQGHHALTLTSSGLNDTWSGSWISAPAPIEMSNFYKPKKIVFIDNKITKCVFWDGTEVFVEVKGGDIFDEEIGVALCVAHYLYRDESKGKRKFLRAIKRLAERPKSPEKKVEQKAKK